MVIKRVTYDLPIEAFDAIVRSLSAYESKYNMTSADFFSQYKEGKLGDLKDFVEWAGDYQHYMDLKRKLEQKLKAIA
jgi:hypothetical protein